MDAFFVIKTREKERVIGLPQLSGHRTQTETRLVFPSGHNSVEKFSPGGAYDESLVRSCPTATRLMSVPSGSLTPRGRAFFVPRKTAIKRTRTTGINTTLFFIFMTGNSR